MESNKKIRVLIKQQKALKEKMDAMAMADKVQAVELLQWEYLDEEESEPKVPAWSFSNLKIATKLAIGFMVVIVLLGAVGFVGFKGTGDVNEGFDKIADHSAPALFALGEIKAAVRTVHTEVLNYALINAELALTEEGAAAAAAAAAAAEEELTEFMEAKEALEEWQDEYAKAVMDDKEEQKFVERIEDAEVAFLKEAQKLIDLKTEGMRGKDILDQTQLLEDAEEVFDEVIHMALAAERKEFAEQDEVADTVAADASRFIFLLTIGSFFIAVILAVFISKSIANPIARLSAVTKKIANGDLAKRAEVYSTDEVGELAQSFNVMTDSLKTTVESIQRKNEELETTTQQLEEAQVQLEDEKGNLEKLVKERTKELADAKEQLEQKVGFQENELQEKNAQLETKVADMEKFVAAATGREEEIIRLKGEVKRLEGGVIGN